MTDTTFEHFDDPIGFALVLDDGSEHEVALERADNNPVPVPTDR